MTRIMLVRIRSLAAIVAFAHALLGAAEPAEAVDTSFKVPLDRPLLCTLTIKVKSSIRIAGGGREVVAKVDCEDERQFVDVFSKSDKEGAEAARTFVRTSSTTNGHADDDALAGATAYFTEKAGTVSVKVSEDRRFLKRTVDGLLKEYDSVGIWLRLPSKAEVGSSYRIDLTPLAPIFVASDAEAEIADSTLTLKSFDAQSGTAVLAGKAGLRAKKSDEGDGMAGTMDFRLDGELHVKPAEGRILRMKLTGTVKGELTVEKAKAMMEGTYTAELKTAVGDAAAKAAKEKPKARMKVASPRGFGVTMSLPVYYDDEETPSPERVYRDFRTIDADKGMAEITMQRLAGDTRDTKAYFDAGERDLRKDHPDLKTQSVSCALGAGRAYLFTMKDPAGVELKVRAEVYPLGPVFLMCRVRASPALFDVAEKEFIAARKTLRKGAEAL